MPTPRINRTDTQDLAAMLALRHQGLTYDSIGQRYGTSRQRIRQLLSQMTDSVKAKVWQRANGCCEICGKPEAQCSRRLEYHHKEPIIEGYNQPENLLLLCQSCHRHIHKDNSPKTRSAKKAPMTPVKRLAVLIDTELHRRFKSLVADKGLDMSKVIRELVERWLKENETPQDKKEGQR